MSWHRHQQLGEDAKSIADVHEPSAGRLFKTLAVAAVLAKVSRAIVVEVASRTARSSRLSEPPLSMG